MASDINTNSINTGFPVAGQNNDSQGFRDNFASIKNALDTASTEITDLQIRSAKINEVNDFKFEGTLKSVKLQNSGLVSVTDILGSSILDFSQGSYFQTTITESTTFGVSNWPGADLANNSYFQARIEVKPTGPMQINFKGINGGVIRAEAGTILPYSTNNTDSLVWDLWTNDNGSNVFVKFVGRFPKTTSNPPIVS